MADALDKMVDHHAEQKYLLDQLSLWRHTAKAGYSSEEVKSFSFRPKFLTRKQCKYLRRMWGSPAACDTHFNCVVLVTGELREIPLYPRPTR
jgi:hypothetical protein